MNKDYFGCELAIGDEVLFVKKGRSRFLVGLVAGFEDKVSITYAGTTTYRNGVDLVKKRKVLDGVRIKLEMPKGIIGKDNVAMVQQSINQQVDDAVGDYVGKALVELGIGVEDGIKRVKRLVKDDTKKGVNQYYYYFDIDTEERKLLASVRINYRTGTLMINQRVPDLVFEN